MQCLLLTHMIYLSASSDIQINHHDQEGCRILACVPMLVYSSRVSLLLDLKDITSRISRLFSSDIISMSLNPIDFEMGPSIFINQRHPMRLILFLSNSSSCYRDSERKSTHYDTLCIYLCLHLFVCSKWSWRRTAIDIPFHLPCYFLHYCKGYLCWVSKDCSTVLLIGNWFPSLLSHSE